MTRDLRSGRNLTQRRVLAALLLSLTVSSCGKLGSTTVAAGVPFASDPVAPVVRPNVSDASLPPGLHAVSLTFDRSSANVPMGSTLPITANLKLSDGKLYPNHPALQWSSDHPEIATVSKKGVVTPVALGTARITARVEGVAANLDLVVGQGTFIWQQITTDIHDDLQAVKLVSDNEAWAVGSHATILHYYNGAWNIDTSAATATATLRSVSFVDPSEGWAVGGDGGTPLILHYTGGGWQSVPAPVQGTLTGVSMVTPTEVWACGYTPAGRSLVLRWNGSGWTKTNLDVSSKLNSIDALTPNNVWVAGDGSFLARPGLYQFDGQAWHEANFSDKWPYFKFQLRKYNMRSIKMLNGSTGWAVGEYNDLSVSGKKKAAFFVYEFVNNYWVPGQFDTSSGQDLSLVPLNGIGMLNGSTGWVLGKTVDAKTWYDFGQDHQPIYGNLFDNRGGTLSLSKSYQINTMPPSFNGIDVLQDGNSIIVGDKGFIMMHQYDLTASLNNFYGNSTNTFNSGTSNGFAP